MRAALFARASLVAIPSLWPEPFGLVGLEAAQFGVPAVAFDVGGIGEWLTDGGNGILVPIAGGARAFGDAVASLPSSATPPLGPAWRLGGATAAPARRFTADAHIAKLEQVLGQQLREPSPPA